jgi:sarcosine oxidase
MTPTDQHFEVIVIGLGGVGSATLAHMARAGHKVLGIDQFSPPHAHGSSHGQTRIIRKAYFEHSNYVPMLERAYSLWSELEHLSGRQLYFRTGLLQLGPAQGEVLSGVRRSALEHRLEVETMSAAQAACRFPGISPDESWTAIIEANAGYLLVEECVTAHLEVARRDSAQLLLNCPVHAWHCDGNSVCVDTANGVYRADRLVIAAGPWADKVLRSVRLPLKIIRKHVYWYAVQPDFYADASFPCFFFDTKQGFFYGMPVRAGQGLKVGRHSGGEEADPDQSTAHPSDLADRNSVEEFLGEHLPRVMTEQLLNWSGCFYTMTPDQHFIVDQLPDNPLVTVVAGLSGHGFKFSCVLGEIAASMATARPVEFDVGFLSLKRFQSHH